MVLRTESETIAAAIGVALSHQERSVRIHITSGNWHENLDPRCFAKRTISDHLMSLSHSLVILNSFEKSTSIV